MNNDQLTYGDKTTTAASRSMRALLVGIGMAVSLGLLAACEEKKEEQAPAATEQPAEQPATTSP